jgi:hypothetical protein
LIPHSPIQLRDLLNSAISDEIEIRRQEKRDIETQLEIAERNLHNLREKLRQGKVPPYVLLAQGMPLPSEPAPDAPVVPPRLYFCGDDGVFRVMVCPNCQRRDFLSYQGFVNHCRIRCNLYYSSHAESRSLCGVVVPESEVQEYNNKRLEAMRYGGDTHDSLGRMMSPININASGQSMLTLPLQLTQTVLFLPDKGLWQWNLALHIGNVQQSEPQDEWLQNILFGRIAKVVFAVQETPLNTVTQSQPPFQITRLHAMQQSTQQEKQEKQEKEEEVVIQVLVHFLNRERAESIDHGIRLCATHPNVVREEQSSLFYCSVPAPPNFDFGSLNQFDQAGLQNGNDGHH